MSLTDTESHKRGVVCGRVRLAVKLQHAFDLICSQIIIKARFDVRGRVLREMTMTDGCDADRVWI